MTTRRDILTGLATVPILPVLPGAANATPDAQPAITTSTAPSQPTFAYDLDHRLWQELHLLESTLARVKDQLLVAGNLHPLVRCGALFEMRCTFNTLGMATDWARMLVEQQRLEADAAAKAWKAKNEELAS